MSKPGMSVNNIIIEKCSRDVYRLAHTEMDDHTISNLRATVWPPISSDLAIKNGLTTFTETIKEMCMWPDIS